MARYQLTPQARDDLFDIWTFIARDSPQAADRVELAIHENCDLLVDTPLAGQIRKDLTDLPVRFWVVQPFTNYFIVYDPTHSPLRIIRLIHAARNLPSLL